MAEPKRNAEIYTKFTFPVNSIFECRFCIFLGTLENRWLVVNMKDVDKSKLNAFDLERLRDFKKSGHQGPRAIISKKSGDKELIENLKANLKSSEDANMKLNAELKSQQDLVQMKENEISRLNSELETATKNAKQEVDKLMVKVTAFQNTNQGKF